MSRWATNKWSYWPDFVIWCAKHLDNHVDLMYLWPAWQQWMVGQQFTQDTARCPEVNITWQLQCHIYSIDKEQCGSFSLFYKFCQVHLMFFCVRNCGEWKGFNCTWHRFNTSVVCQKNGLGLIKLQYVHPDFVLSFPQNFDWALMETIKKFVWF